MAADSNNQTAEAVDSSHLTGVIRDPIVSIKFSTGEESTGGDSRDHYVYYTSEELLHRSIGTFLVIVAIGAFIFLSSRAEEKDKKDKLKKS